MQIVSFIPMALSKRPADRWHKNTETAGMPRLGRVLQALGLLLAFISGAPAQSPPPTEYQVKAAFLYNFAKFVEWPAGNFPNESAPLKICVFGQDPFGEGLREVTHEKIVNGRKIEVSGVTDLRQAKSCHILFIASSEKTQVKQILAGLYGTSVLTVGDSKGFVEQGGMINFVLENERVQFEVNRKTAEQAGLKISSKLLSVAKSVTV
jgi:uncharacterized protein DUF4154